MMRSIEKYFSAASETYDQVALIQQESAEQLCQDTLSIMRDHDMSIGSILDLGTGTGYVPYYLEPFLPKAQWLLNDCSMRMLTQARSKLKHLSDVYYHCGDFTTSVFPFQDLIISNLAFQWAPSLSDMVQKCLQGTRLLAFSCLLEDTFIEWHTCVQKETDILLSYYPTEQSVTNMIQSLGGTLLSKRTRTYRQGFDNIHLFLKHLKHVGAFYHPFSLPWPMLRRIMKRHQGPMQASYCVFYGVVMV